MDVKDINSTVKNLVDEFSNLRSWEDRYRLIIEKGKKLPALEPELQIEKFRIKGCQSQVWLVPERNNASGDIVFKADSDSLLVKGIVSLLLEVYNNRKPSDILATSPQFLKEIGITEHLSMNRTNGLSSMVKQIQLYAQVYQAMELQ